jgi:hypothetical protein
MDETEPPEYRCGSGREAAAFRDLSRVADPRERIRGLRS